MSESRMTPAELLKLLDDGRLSSEDSDQYLKLLEAQGDAVVKASADLESFVDELRASVSISSVRLDPPVTAQFREQVKLRARSAAMTETVGSVASQQLTSEVIENLPNVSAPITDAHDTIEPLPAIAPTQFLSPAMQADEIGRMGAYRILRKMGQGGMGMVFEAQDSHLQRRVAIKTMLPKIAADDNCRQRFLQEAQAAARVEHDHICPIYQVGEHAGVPFIAMPFLIGETLDARMQTGTISHHQAVSIAIQVAQGLAAAHAANLVHRDIKPSNIWLERKEDNASEFTRVRILDFGLAQIESDGSHLTQSGVVLGTPSYMSPEQARSQAVDARSDLFSLGTVLYELLTGHRPFKGDSALSTMTSLIVDQPKPPHLIQPTVPRELSQFVMQLLSKSPADRPPTAKQVVGQLQTFHQQMSTASVQPTVLEPTVQVGLPKSTRLSRRVGIFIAAGLLGTAGLLAWAGVLVLKTPDGLLTVEYEGDTDVRLRDGAIEIYDSDNRLKYTLSPSEKNKSLAPGMYRVKVVGADGVKLETESFEMSKAGAFTLRATASPEAAADNATRSANAGESSPSVTLGMNFFPGDPQIVDNFELPLRSTLKDRPNVRIENGRCVASRIAGAKGPLGLYVGKGLDHGALTVRCRAEKSQMFVNFCIRSDERRFRWLSLSVDEHSVSIDLHRHDLENGTWAIKNGANLLKKKFDAGLVDSQGWADLSVRWSDSSYDAWVNNTYIGGGLLPTEELRIGNPTAPQICVGPGNLPQLAMEIEYIGIWDQSALDNQRRLPSQLSSPR